MRVIYACVRALGGLEECEPLCEPVEGWVWIRCEDVGALMRDLARMISRGCDAGYALTARGEALDVLELDKADLSGSLSGEVEFVCGDPLKAFAKLVELGAERVSYSEGRLVAVLSGVQLEAVLREGIVPIVWRRAVPGSSGGRRAARR